MRASAVGRVCGVAVLVAGMTLSGANASFAAAGRSASPATATLAGGVLADPATFTGQGQGASEAEAVAVAERDARRQAAEQGFTNCRKVSVIVAVPIWDGAPWYADVVIACTRPSKPA
jgi:hypothetical protein